jgi:hypothetical protein
MFARAVVGRSLNVGILSSRRLLASKRTFFASSTDFTRLLAEAEVHCIPQDDGSTQYVMAASGTDVEMVKKVPQLHLARLSVLDKTLFGAKVVNRTLGSPSVVCEKLIDAALKDAGAGAKARSTLHGLSEWVLKGIKEKKGIDAVSSLKEAEIKALAAIALAAGGELDENVYTVGKEGWEKVAREYVEKGNGGEAMLYVSKGGKLVAVEHLADTSEFANTSGGTMAVFSF